MFPTIALPGVVTGLARSRNCILAPETLTAARVVCVDETPYAVLAARHSCNDFVFDRQRSGRNAVTLHGVGNLRLPDERAAAGIERNQRCIERSEVDPVSQDRYTAIHAVAFIGVYHFLRPLILPDQAPRTRIQREDLSGRSGGVHHSAGDDWYRLHNPVAGHRHGPLSLQLGHIRLID